jgi:hypothetical protein
MSRLGWADALILCCLLFVVFAFGMWAGSRERRKHRRIPWHRNAHDPRDAQGKFQRIWRV